MSGHPYDLYLFQYAHKYNSNGFNWNIESLRIISYNIHIQEYYVEPISFFNPIIKLTTILPFALKHHSPAFNITVTKYQIRLPNKIFNENDLKFNPNTGKFGILDIATKIE